MLLSAIAQIHHRVIAEKRSTFFLSFSMGSTPTHTQKPPYGLGDISLPLSVAFSTPIIDLIHGPYCLIAVSALIRHNKGDIS